MGLGKYDKINFVSINSYFKAVELKKFSGDRIALIYAQGDIIDGAGNEQTQIGSSDYIKLIRKARVLPVAIGPRQPAESVANFRFMVGVVRVDEEVDVYRCRPLGWWCDPKFDIWYQQMDVGNPSVVLVLSERGIVFD